MNRDKVKEILDKTNINVLDEADIIEYIDELEKVKEEYIKSLDKLDVLDNRIDKAIEYIGLNEEDLKQYDIYDVNGIELLKILRNEGEIKYLGYSDKECINCGRERVERYSDGTEICEKCNFDQNKKEYVMR